MTTKYNIETIENGKLIVIEMGLEDRISYEVAQLGSMTDQEVCRTYNVDSRDEAIEGINEYWKEIA